MVAEAECDRVLGLWLFFVFLLEKTKNKYLLNTTKSYLNYKIRVEKSSVVYYNEIY